MKRREFITLIGGRGGCALRRLSIQEPDDRHRWLLRARREASRPAKSCQHNRRRAASRCPLRPLQATGCAGSRSSGGLPTIWIHR
jgi:hypothetical protein